MNGGGGRGGEGSSFADSAPAVLKVGSSYGGGEVSALLVPANEDLCSVHRITAQHTRQRYGFALPAAAERGPTAGGGGVGRWLCTYSGFRDEGVRRIRKYRRRADAVVFVRSVPADPALAATHWQKCPATV